MATESVSVNECTCQYPGVLCRYCEWVALTLVPTERCITPADTVQADRLASRAADAQRRERQTCDAAHIAACRLRRDLARARA